MKTYHVYFGDACVPAVSVKTDRVEKVMEYLPAFVEDCEIVATTTGDEVTLVVKHNFGA